jgi:hypothetical protein
MQFQHLKEKMAELKGLGQIISSMEDITDERMQKIARLLSAVNNNNNHNEEKPFNIILASSDIYYRENYHSDIISDILNHDKKYVELFIKYLEKFDVVKYYTKPEITREEDRVDILIKDDETKHCMIIENKINNANDTYRQLPKYYLLKKGQGYTVDAIAYLSMDGNKRPNKSTWEIEDHKLNLDEKIIYCAVSDNDKPEKDLINGFISKCLLEAKSIQESTFFRQYIDLLHYLKRRKKMDDKLMKEFYIQMKDDVENYKNAVWLSSNFGSTITKFGNLIPYRRDCIYDKLVKNFPGSPYNPYKWPYRWEDNMSSLDAGIDMYIFDIPNESVEIKIYCRCEQDTTTINIMLKKESTIPYFDLIKIILDAIGFDDFNTDKNPCQKIFSFPEEEDIFYHYLDKLLSSLKDSEKKEEIIKQISDKINGKL